MYIFTFFDIPCKIWEALHILYLIQVSYDGFSCPSPWPIVVAPWHVFCVPLRCVGSSSSSLTQKSPHFLPFSFDYLMFLGIINHLIMANEVLLPWPIQHEIESLSFFFGVVLISVPCLITSHFPFPLWIGLQSAFSVIGVSGQNLANPRICWQ